VGGRAVRLARRARARQLRLENLRFVTPVKPGDAIRVTLTAKQITPRETDEYGEVRWDAVITPARRDRGDLRRADARGEGARARGLTPSPAPLSEDGGVACFRGR
jgi:acyl dehydratase